MFSKHSAIIQPGIACGVAYIVKLYIVCVGVDLLCSVSADCALGVIIEDMQAGPRSSELSDTRGSERLRSADTV